MRTESIHSKYPLLGAYGRGHQTFLDDDAAIRANVEERMRAVWPFLVRQVLTFASTLKPRERVNFDVEDILSELWVKVAERSEKWSPERGKWVTFVGAVVDRELAGIRDRANTIQSPRNSSCRVKAYRKREADGTLTERCRKTAEDIARTSGGTSDLAVGSEAEGRRFGDPVLTLTLEETRRETAEVLEKALAFLTPTQAEVLSRREGLRGHEPETESEVASVMGLSEDEVRHIRWQARAALRKRLIALKHPLVPARHRKTG